MIWLMAYITMNLEVILCSGFINIQIFSYLYCIRLSGVDLFFLYVK